MRFLDTTILIRYLTGDDPEKAAACYDLFQRVKRGEEEVTTCESMLAEVVYLLSSRALYGLSHTEISARLRPILMLRGFKLPRRRVYLRALDLYATYPVLDFEDVLAVAHMESQGLTEILTYDTDFNRVTGIRRVEPEPPPRR